MDAATSELIKKLEACGEYENAKKLRASFSMSAPSHSELFVKRGGSRLVVFVRVVKVIDAVAEIGTIAEQYSAIQWAKSQSWHV